MRGIVKFLCASKVQIFEVLAYILCKRYYYIGKEYIVDMAQAVLESLALFLRGMSY